MNRLFLKGARKNFKGVNKLTSSSDMLPGHSLAGATLTAGNGLSVVQTYNGKPYYLLTSYPVP
jgi:hypothetical protein